MRSILFRAVIASVVLASVLFAQNETGGEDPQKKVAGARPSAEARRALGEVAAAEDSIKGLKGPERQQAIESAATRYEQVAASFAAERAASATAWYKAGELWRRGGSLAKAESAYEKALQNDDGRYRERALFQRAGMQRRQKKFDEAIASYQSAATVKPSSTRAHEARLWIARCLSSAGKPDEAIREFRAALESSNTPRRIIDASNYLAKALIAKGDLVGARAAIEHAEKSSRSAIDQGGAEGERTRKALEKMSARKALQRARDKANRAGADAVQLERDRRR